MRNSIKKCKLDIAEACVKFTDRMSRCPIAFGWWTIKILIDIISSIIEMLDQILIRLLILVRRYAIHLIVIVVLGFITIWWIVTPTKKHYVESQVLACKSTSGFFTALSMPKHVGLLVVTGECQVTNKRIEVVVCQESGQLVQIKSKELSSNMWILKESLKVSE
jgi:hypothetical protein